MAPWRPVRIASLHAGAAQWMAKSTLTFELWSRVALGSPASLGVLLEEAVDAARVLEKEGVQLVCFNLLALNRTALGGGSVGAFEARVHLSQRPVEAGLHLSLARQHRAVDGAVVVGVSEPGERGSELDGLAEPLGVLRVGEIVLEEAFHHLLRVRVLAVQEGLQFVCIHALLRPLNSANLFHSPKINAPNRTAAACAANQSTEPLTRPSGGARGFGGAARERGLGGAVRGVLPFRRVSEGGRVKPWRLYAVMASVRAIRASLETALAVPGAHLT
eukprot:scaffold11776_cov63-Phaeocystis_antarctica.AAC.4